MAENDGILSRSAEAASEGLGGCRARLSDKIEGAMENPGMIETPLSRSLLPWASILATTHSCSNVMERDARFVDSSDSTY
jgi:hypothetical protein